MKRFFHISYVANIRLPTEKAHGYQVMKMCEAMAGQGAKITLFYPRRIQSNSAFLQNTDPFEYYGVRRIFSLRRLRNFDIMRLESFFPHFLFLPILALHSVIWGAYALFTARGSDAVYLRDDMLVAVLASFFGIRFIYEAHRLPKGRIGRIIMQSMRGRSLVFIVALTSSIRDKLVKDFNFDAARIIVLPDGVDFDLFSESKSKDIFREQAGLPLNIPIIGYVGTFSALGYEKGVAFLIGAIPAILTEHPDAVLVCVGGPDLLIPYYRALAVDQGVGQSVRFIGHVSPLRAAAFMRACSILAIPLPYNEFFAEYTSPMKLFEYMASGVPIVASDLPSIREILSDNTGFFAKPGDSHSIAMAINAAFCEYSLAEKRAAEALRAVRAYSWAGRAQAVFYAASSMI